MKLLLCSGIIKMIQEWVDTQALTPASAIMHQDKNTNSLKRIPLAMNQAHTHWNPPKNFKI